MKPRICVLMALMLFAACGAATAQDEKAPAEEKAPPESSSVTIKEMKGGVDVRPAADAAWQKASAGMVITTNWEISTGLRGQAVLLFEDNSEVVVQRLTEMKISEFKREEGTVKTRLQMKYGAVRVKVKKGTASNDFKVASPTATASVRGTKIQEMSYYRGLGGKIRMGDEGKIGYSVNPTIPLGPNQQSDDKLTNPIVYAKMSNWVPVNFSGHTKEEAMSSVWHNTPGAGVWDDLIPGSTSDSKIHGRQVQEPPCNGHDANGGTNGGTGDPPPPPPTTPPPTTPTQPW